MTAGDFFPELAIIAAGDKESSRPTTASARQKHTEAMMAKAREAYAIFGGSWKEGDSSDEAADQLVTDLEELE